MKKYAIIAGLVIYCLVISVSGYSQNGKMNATDSISRTEFKIAWEDFKHAIFSKNMKSTLSFFTDSLKRNFDSFEEKTIEEFISNKWFNDKYFLKSLKGLKMESKTKNGIYEIKMTVQYPRTPGEEGDARVVYFFKFKKHGDAYQLFSLAIAG